jgi:hypothetical protein
MHCIKKKFILILLFLFVADSIYSEPKIEINPARSLLQNQQKTLSTIPTERNYKILIENIDSSTFVQAENQSQGVIRFIGRIKVNLKNGVLLQTKSL